MNKPAIAPANLKIIGNGTAAGGRYRSIRLVGEAEIEGDFQCDRLQVLGTCQFHGSAAAKAFRLLGTAELERGFSGDEVKIIGMLTVNEDFSAESFILHGGFHIGGLLNAETIRINPHGPCKVKEIGGNAITIKSRFTWFGAFNHHAQVSCGSVEGSEIYLENTRAEVVRGDTVTIGPGCEVDLVEYKVELKSNKGAKIHESRKV